MGDRAYARFAIPVSVLADETKAELVRHIFEVPQSEFQRVVLSTPSPDEAAGHDSFAIRMIDGTPFLVFEYEEANYGGTDIEAELYAAVVPFIQHNGAGDEYGPSSTAYDGIAAEVVRLDDNLDPIAAIGMRDGKAVADPSELADLEQYHRIRQAVLVWPAMPSQ